MIAELWDVVSPTDGRGVRSLWLLARRPGALTAAYMRGVRQPFLTPLRLFLLVNLGYFVFATATHQGTFTTPLAVHVGGTPYSPLVKPLVDRRLAQRHLTLDAYARRFDAAAVTQAKSLVGATVPLFALIVAGVEARRHRPALHHLAFAFHAMAVMLVAVMTVGLFAGVAFALAARGGIHVAPSRTDDVSSGLVIAVLAVWLAMGLHTAYGESRIGSLWKAAVLTFGIAIVLNAYRVLLFLTTFWVT